MTAQHTNPALNSATCSKFEQLSPLAIALFYLADPPEIFGKLFCAFDLDHDDKNQFTDSRSSIIEFIILERYIICLYKHIIIK